ncbi:Retrovirus-related Pol polyprotein from transposon 17.6 [Linum grandiflorum]
MLGRLERLEQRNDRGVGLLGPYAGGGNVGNQRQLAHRVKIEFPKFIGGEDPTTWVCRAEQFFEYYNTTEADKVLLASIYMEGEAQLWLQVMKEQGPITWEQLKVGMHSRFGPTRFESPFGELTKLQQRTTVRDYQTEFERLLVRAGQLAPEQQVACFISGLATGIRTEVQAGQPETLSAAIGLARLYEEKVMTTLKLGPAAGTAARLPIKRLNPTEIRERRDKGLCFNCDEKFVPGHRCKKLFLIETIEDGEDDEVDLEMGGGTGFLSISLNAVTGMETPETMKLLTTINYHQLRTLVDSGSNHNFLSLRMARKMSLIPENNTQFTVTVGNGETMKSPGRCSGMVVQVQGMYSRVDLHILPIPENDLILGVQWLRELGPIQWDFNNLTMEFGWQDHWIKLQGQRTPESRLVDEHEVLREVKRKGEGYILYLLDSNSSDSSGEDLDGMDEFNGLLAEYGDLFREPSSLPPNRREDHRIPLDPGSQPVNSRPYRYPHYLKEEISKLVQEMLHTGIVRHSQSPYSSPVLMVKKHDGSWRMCVDYRSLNQITIKDKFLIPVIDELFDELHGACCFTKLDLCSGYYQIRVVEEDIPKTAFRTHQGHYEFLVMPFGLTNAPSTFQSLMNEVFRPLFGKFVLVFFDDILVYSRTRDEHLSHLADVFYILRKNQLYVKKEKCTFATREVHYLGHIISANGVAADPEKIQAMVDWPEPQSPKALRGFLGLTGYYRKFVRDYGSIARPLTQMLKKGGFEWSDQPREAFKNLKTAITTAPVLRLPDFTQPFVVECDACANRVGAFLMQEGRAIAYFSQAIQGKSLLLSVYEKEMLALALAVKRWRPYLLGCKFVIRTDQRSLKYLLEQKITTSIKRSGSPNYWATTSQSNSSKVEKTKLQMRFHANLRRECWQFRLL